MTGRRTARRCLVSLRNGTTVLRGKYRIDRVLGEGGMAIVYEATHVDFGRRYALKKLHPQFSLDASVRKRFVQEGKVAARLHSGAVEIFDWEDDDDGAPILIMEL